MADTISASKPIRKVGEPRVETISVDLDAAEIAEATKKAMQLRNQQDALKQELVGVRQEFKSRAQRLIDAEVLARRQASTGKADVEIALQDYLTSSNEVVTVRIDTQEVFGRRTATMSELQGDLFDDDDESGFGSKPS